MRAVVALLLVGLQSSQWRPEDRVLVSDFSYIAAVAASPFLLYAATPRGLLIYDRAARRWELPVTALDGYPRGVRVALADRADEAVWLGTVDGWARYDPRIRMWQSGPVAGGVSDLAQDEADPAGGIYLRAGTGWAYLPRGGLIASSSRAPPPGAVRPLDPQSAFARAPQADALRALILTDPRLRTHQFTSAASTPDRADLFFGTTGLGVVRIDGFGAQWEALTFGLPTPTARALAPTPDGVWVGLRQDGLAFVSSDLTAMRWLGGQGTRGLGFRQAHRLLGRRNRLWIATELGVTRVDPANERAELFSMDEAIALANGPDGVWVGTVRGLSFVSDSGAMVRYDVGGASVLSVLEVGDSLWMGTTAGLALLPPGARQAIVPPAIANTPTLRAAVVALARRGDTLVAATLDQLAWRDPRTGGWTVLRPRADLGRLTTLSADRDGVWVGGDFGLALWIVGSGAFRALRVPYDLPAGVRDLLAAPPYLWVATDSGVVRLVREAVINR